MEDVLCNSWCTWCVRRYFREVNTGKSANGERVDVGGQRRIEDALEERVPLESERSRRRDICDPGILRTGFDNEALKALTAYQAATGSIGESLEPAKVDSKGILGY